MGARVARFREVIPMSLSECDRFSADIQSNAALRAEAEKAWTDKSHEAPLSAVVALAVSKGYSVTLAEAREHLKAKAAAAGKALYDADLDAIAAGQQVISAGGAPNMSREQFIYTYMF
jgi:hypothetical protein